MNDTKHSNHGRGQVDGEHVHHDRSPYWRRAHRDWRFWVGLFLMFAAISIYVMSDDLSLVPRTQPQPVSSTGQK